MASARTKNFWKIFFGAALILFIIIAIVSGVYYQQETVGSRVPAFSVTSPGSTYDVNALKSQNYLLNVGVGYTKFGADDGKLQLELGFSPQNNLTNSHNEPKVPVCISTKDTDFEFKAGEEIDLQGAAATLVGDINIYPFDWYTGSIIIQAYTGTQDANDTEKVDCGDPLAINPLVIGSADGFVISAQAYPGINDDGSVDYGSTKIVFTARRTRVHQGFSCLMFTVMWALCCMLTYITLWTWKGGKRVEMGVISMNSALLFAVPRVRDAQPNIPKMGIVQDLAGYCWIVFIIACSLFSLQINFILRKERKKEVREKRDSADSQRTLLHAIDLDEKVKTH